MGSDMITDKQYYIRAARRAKRKEWFSSGKFGRFIAKVLTISFVLFYIGLGWASNHNKPSFLGIELAQGEHRFSRPRSSVYYNADGKLTVWTERSGAHTVPAWIQWFSK